VWWAVLVLIPAAAQNAVLEEVIGRPPGHLAAPAPLAGRRDHRGEGRCARLIPPHQVSAFLGNAVMGVVFSLFYPHPPGHALVVAHTVLDVVAFVGHALLPKELFGSDR
jgi:hypothetical protein